MYSLFIIPDEYCGKNYLKTHTIQHLRPLKLVSYEIKLDELIKTAIKVFKKLQKDATDEKIFEILSCFEWTFTTNSFDCLIVELEDKIEQINHQIKVNEAKNEIKTVVNSTKCPITPQYLFLDRLYCSVKAKNTKKFERDFKNILKIGQEGELVLYEFYCLKYDSNQIKELMKEMGIGLFEEKNINENNNKIKTEKGLEYTETCEIKRQELLYQIANVLMVACISKGLAEELNKYSLIDGYKFKLIPNIKEHEEVKYLKKKNKIKDVEENISIVKLEIN